MSSIGIDCRFGSLPVGIGTYIRGLVPELIKELSGHHCVLFVRDTNERWLSAIPKNVTLVQVNAPHYSIREQILMPIRTRQASLDVLFVPHFNIPVLSKVRKVVTIHDLILHRYPNSAPFLKRLVYRFLMKSAVKNAKDVISVSKFTASELKDIYGTSSTVISEGVDPLFQHVQKGKCSSVLKKFDLTPGYFFYVGNAKEHKNVQMLIDAHASLDSPAPLILRTSGKETQLLSLHSGVRILSDVDTQDMPALYSSAKCFVTASLYEGFCLPIVEARSCGCPVICTNVTATPEVAGHSAKLVEPTIASIAAALQNPPSTSDFSDTYSWHTAAKETAAILLSHG